MKIISINKNWGLIGKYNLFNTIHENIFLKLS